MVGTIVAVIGAILASAKTIVDWLGRVDFIVSHQTELGWIGGAMEYLVAPPWWLPWCVLASGLALIWADSRRSTSAGQPRPNLTFECNLAGLPSRCPAEGRIASMRLSYSPGAESAPPINLIIRHCLPGDALDWFSDIKFPQVYRCEITNYGDAPLLQVMLKLISSIGRRFRTTPMRQRARLGRRSILTSGRSYLQRSIQGRTTQLRSMSTTKAPSLLSSVRRVLRPMSLLGRPLHARLLYR